MTKTHPDQMPDEKPGVTIESRATDITANRAMRAVLRDFDAWAFDMTNGFQVLAKLLKKVLLDKRLVTRRHLRKLGYTR